VIVAYVLPDLRTWRLTRISYNPWQTNLHNKYILYICLQGSKMQAVSDTLLVKFRAKDTQFGVTRTTVKALATELDVSETQVIHMALSKFAGDVLPAYAPDDGPLTAKQIAAIRKDAAKHLPKGKVLFRQDLFQ
jgi:hypothetical protein